MIQLYLGEPSIDKQQWIFKEIGKKRKVTVITPEQNTLALERELIKALAVPGMIDIQVVSFSRLLKKLSGIFEPEEDAMTSIGKRLLFSQILREKRDSFKLFTGREKPGFTDELKDTIDRLEVDQVDVGAIRALEETAKGDLLKAKLHDLALIYERYLEVVQETFFDQKRQLALFKAYAKDFRLFEEEVFLVGFKHLDNLHLEMLKTMEEHAMISMDLPYNRGEAIYELTELTRKRLDMLFDTKEVKVLSSARFGGLSKAILTGESLEGLSKPRFFEAEDRYEEVEFIGLDILKQVSEKGRALGSIRILTTDLEDYGFIFKSTFETLGIDLFLDERKPLHQARIIKSVLSLCMLFFKNFRRIDLLSYLKNSLHQDAGKDLDVFENYLLSQGINFGDFEKPFLDETMEELRVAWVEPILAYRERFKESLSMGSFSALFLELLKELEYPAKIEEEQRMYHELNLHEEELVIAQGWNTLYEILMQIKLLSDDTPVSFRDFKTALEKAITEATVGIIPPSEGKITLAEVHRTTHQPCEVLYFSGMNEHLLPKSYGDGAFLKEKEKEQLIQMGYYFHDTSDFKEALDSVDQHTALSLVSEELVLSYAKSDYSSDSIKESLYYKRAKDRFEEPKVERGLSRHYYYHENTLRRYSVEALLENRDELLLLSKGSLEDYKERLNARQTTQMVRRQDQDFKASVSRLERFVSCPFNYFVRYDLGAKEREEFVLENMILGSLHHEVIEGALKAYATNQISADQVDEYIENLFRELLKEEDRAVFLSSASNAYLVSRAKRVARFVLGVIRNQLKEGPYWPKHFEIPVHMRMSGYEFQGVIDRVDESADGYRVIDYKSGNKSFNLSRVYQGIDLQLALYAGSLREKLKDQDQHPLPLKGMYYFNIKDPFVNKGEDRYEKLQLDGIEITETPTKDALSKAGFQNLYHRVEQASGEIVEQIREGRVHPEPLKYQGVQTCQYCAYHAICRFDEFQRGFLINEVEHLRANDVLKRLEVTHEMDQ